MKITLRQIDIPLGFQVYRGPSMIDGKPILVIATGFRVSDNPKTGNMIQCWIIREDMKPTEAYSSGEDVSVCGDCVHRTARTCYVNVFQAPYAVHKAWSENKYPILTADALEWFRGKLVRFGAYGDPAAAPAHVWQQIKAVAKGTTAYTHQWKRCDPAYQDFCMASVDSPQQAEKAKAMGWKTFRVLADFEELGEREIYCPASDEAGKVRTCSTCMACKGGTYKGQGTIAIRVHGGGKSGSKGKRWNAIRRRQVSKKGWVDLVPAMALPCGV